MEPSAVVLCAALVACVLQMAIMVSQVASAPAEHLIPELPGQPPVLFKQYGGYVEVDALRGRALYYYFVEAENDKDGTTPLVLWLNGGPGCSSLGAGAFTEIGPFYTRNGSLSKNDKAWNKVTNLLFLESPAGVGFSYFNDSSDNNVGDDQTAQDAMTFLIEWFKKFPEYQGRDFYIAGESYGGHYVPQLASAVVHHNNISGQIPIPLKGVLIGNPLLDSEIDNLLSEIKFLWSHGMISDDTYEKIIANCKFELNAYQTNECVKAVNDTNAETTFSNSFITPYDVIADACVLDYQAQSLKNLMNRNFGPKPKSLPSPCFQDLDNAYFNLPEVQSALHARKTNWVLCSSTLNYTAADSSNPILPTLKHLINNGLRVWVFSGDQDSVIPLIGTRKQIATLAANMGLKQTSPYTVWFKGTQVAGWTSSWGRLLYATVRGAGHTVPAYQPARAIELFKSFIAGTGLPPGPY